MVVSRMTLMIINAIHRPFCFAADVSLFFLFFVPEKFHKC